MKEFWKYAFLAKKNLKEYQNGIYPFEMVIIILQKFVPLMIRKHSLYHFGRRISILYQ